MGDKKFLLFCVTLVVLACCVTFAVGAWDTYREELGVQQMEYDFIVHIAGTIPRSCVYWGEYRSGGLLDTHFFFARQMYNATKDAWQSEGLFVVTHDRENNAITICPVTGSKL